MSMCEKNLEEIFHKASEITETAERAEYVEKACAGDQTLRAEVEFLLQSDDDAGDFMDIPVMDPSVFVKGSPLTEGPGSVIGRYKLLEQIGEGGMAVVYMAEQQYPVQRKVALKFVKLGMDSEQVIARFEAERQALALMDHPNIARVFDAGTTESGRPYFVMELVKGMSITQFCDENQMSTQDRLNLFVTVCQAVQHAHQKGIIHRDIKPSNVMVTFHDGRPVPKVIDFGIAKATNRRLTEKTLFTHYAQIIGTPEYMSPEQAEMSDLDVDTRTDVYSLGVLLYELLVGSPPFTPQYLRGKAYAEIQRILREEEPTKPSTKVSSQEKASVDIAKQRSTSPDNLCRQIQSDLDWILMKTLEKDRARRYDSVSEFTADIERHLKHEPVLAGPPSTWYRLQKLVQRHRALVTSVGAVVIALLIGLSVSTYFYGRAETAIDMVTTLENRVDLDRGLFLIGRLHTQGSYQAALTEIEPYLQHTIVDPRIRLLYAKILIDLKRKGDAEVQLLLLDSEEPQIASVAYYLLSRINLGKNDTQAQAYRELADKLLPNTAEANAQRALATVNPKEALQCLTRAIKLDSQHYAAREARALLYFSLREYIKMEKDAEAMTILRQKDYLGYALRALAQRELGELDMALSDHNDAIDLCDIEQERPILLDQRQETHCRSGNYQAALHDARECVRLAPDRSVYRATLVTILYVLKEYDEVRQEYDRLQQPSGWGGQYWLTAMSRYMSDTIGVGKPFELPDNLMPAWPPSSPVSPSFYLPTIAGLYQTLHKQATRLVRGSYKSSSWSPSGQQLAYTRSESCRWDDSAMKYARPGARSGRWGIEILDLSSRRTRVLVTEGDSPAWSPDGRFIAFRRATSYGYRTGEDIWLVPTQGGAAQRLVAGASPCWTTDNPTRLYFVSREDQMLCYIDVEHPTPAPVPVVSCPGWHMQVSPDDRFLAYSMPGELTVVELATGEEWVKWVVPCPTALHVRWSPDSREISLGSEGIQTLASGVWIFDVEHRQGRHMLDPMALSCNWSPDRSRLALDCAYPMSEIWLVELDPNLPTWDAFGGGQTRGENLRRNWQAYVKSRQGDGDLLFRFMRNVTAIAIDQYELGEYGDALWTLKHLAEIPELKVISLDVGNLAYSAMSLAHLERQEEAREMLNRLRVICARGETTDEACLYEAEQVLAAQNGSLVSAWEFIQDGQLNQALDLLEAMDVKPSVPVHVENMQSARQALVRAFDRSAQEARHQGHEPQVVLAAYDAALRADPNHVPALRDCAFLLATCTDAGLRNGAQARLYARKACELNAYQDHPCLVSLAAALAECGDFSRAVKWQQQALEQLPEGLSPHELVARLNLYESGRHVHSDRVEPLVAWWPFTVTDAGGEFIQDASGHGLQGTLRGDAEIVTDPNRGPVLSLDGQGDCMECDPDTRFHFVDEISISMWIKVRTFKEWHAIITMYPTWRFSKMPFGKMLCFNCWGLDIQSGNVWGILIGDRNLDDGQWHHLAGVYNGMMMYQYIDGELDASAPVRGRTHPNDASVNVNLGKKTVSHGSDWNGWMDDVRIYNRALSAPEIEALYNGREP